MRALFPCAGIVSAAVLAAFLSSPARGEDPIRSSVVKVLATVRQPDLVKPWTKGSPQEVSGSGAVIEGKRILTCAHVVMYASQLYVQPFQSADKIPAKVIMAAPQVDLAVLSVSDESFFENRPALEFMDALPQMKQKVVAYGYPVGGSDLSVTEGIVSRIEFTRLEEESMGLHIQVDAALNPGNSGGPIISEGKILGLVFSTLMAAENIGYVLPVEEIRMFLEDIEDGVYHGKPQIFDIFHETENEALRAKLGLKAGVGGAMVGEPYKDDASHLLQKWDVVTHIGEHAIGNDAKLPVRDDLRLYFEYLLPGAIQDGKLPLTVFRKGESMKIDLPVSRDRDMVVKSLNGQYPRYLIHGPLVFSPATKEFVSALATSPAGIAYLTYRRSPLLTRRFDRARFAGEELVVIASRMLPHTSTKGLQDAFACTVNTVNGVQIKNLRHLAEVLRDLKDEFTVFEFADRGGQVLVFRTEQMPAITEEILTDNGIRSPCSDDLRDLVK